VPTAGVGSVDGETATVGAFTVKEYELVPVNGAPVPVEESVALMLKLNGPPAVGVPLNKPPVVSVMPAGRAPLETTKLYGIVPPLADICCEYVAATVALVSVDGVTVTADGAPIVTEYACDAVKGLPVPVDESVAFTVKLNGPPVFGVPESTPAVLSVSPPGSVPV